MFSARYPHINRVADPVGDDPDPILEKVSNLKGFRLHLFKLKPDPDSSLFMNRTRIQIRAFQTKDPDPQPCPAVQYRYCKYHDPTKTEFNRSFWQSHCVQCLISAISRCTTVKTGCFAGLQYSSIYKKKLGLCMQ